LLKNTKNLKVFALILLMSMLLIVAVIPNIQSVKAQTTYTVSMFSSCAGTTSPAGSSTAETGTYTYNSGSTQTFTATAGKGFTFLCWIIGAASGPTTSTTNPLSYTINADIGLQPVFIPSGTPAATATPATTPATEGVLVFASYGGSSSPTGTSTTAPYVTYTYNTGSTQTFTATPGTGFKLLCWVVEGGVGGTTSTDTTLSTTINQALAIQPIFIPTSSTVTLPTTATPTPTVNEFSSAIAVILAAVLATVAVGTYTVTRKNKK
jgi:hypothetical protein